MEEEANFWKDDAKINPYERIFVGGFSQGCAISLLYVLSSEKVLGGGIGWSGYLFKSFQLRNHGKIPIIINHGQYDGMVPFKRAVKSYE